MSPRIVPLVESLLVLLLGVALGLIANANREAGLDLSRDHFQARAADPTVSPTTSATTAPEADTPAASLNSEDPIEADSPAEPTESDPPDEPSGIDPLVAERLAAKGLSAAGLSETRAFLEHESYGYGLYMLLDARRPGDFAIDHLPGAKHYDPYAPAPPQELLSELLSAQRVIVYCNGGDCEDSETAALQLLGFGVPATSLAVFAGGYAEWTEHELPLEKGAP